jgi:hypothetical protein
MKGDEARILAAGVMVSIAKPPHTKTFMIISAQLSTLPT